jgi:hypothetical protein
VRGPELRGAHPLVDPQVPAREAGEERDGPVDAIVLAGLRSDQERVRGDGSGVDHRVLGPVGVPFERELVEGLPGWLDPDGIQDAVEPTIDDGGRIGERLGDRLDGELGVGVAGGVGATECRGQCHAEAFRIGLGELGDVVGVGATGVAPQAVEHLVEVVGHGSLHEVDPCRKRVRRRVGGFGAWRATS